MTKIKLLWVVFDFVQAGGQRYVYEICKALDKNKYQIDFLKVNKLGADKNWANEYYYKPTIDLGCRVFFLEQFTNLPVQKKPILQRFTNKVARGFKLKNELLDSKKNTSVNEKLETFFCGYKCINFAGVGVYDSISIKRNLQIKDSVIHILTAKFQGIDIYKNYNKELSYQFVSAFDDVILKTELEGFKNYKHLYFPLSMKLDSFEIPKRQNRKSHLTIGLFTRLTAMKPLDPYFYALKLLKDEGVNVELRIYGAGDPIALGLVRQLEYLYIKSNVVFCGHTESIKQTLIDEDFNLVWFQSANTQLAGYAAIEIAFGAVPQILWDFSYVGGDSEIKNYFPSFTNLIKFVTLSNELLHSSESAIDMGLKQRDFVISKHAIDYNIKTLEELFENDQ